MTPIPHKKFNTEALESQKVRQPRDTYRNHLAGKKRDGVFRIQGKEPFKEHRTKKEPPSRVAAMTGWTMGAGPMEDIEHCWELLPVV